MMLDSYGVEYRAYWVNNMIGARRGASWCSRWPPDKTPEPIHANTWQRADIPTITDPTATTRAVDAPVIEWNIALVSAPEVWAMGYTGQGAVIGGQDTGDHWQHEALIGSYRGWDGSNADHDYNWHDAIHEENPSTVPAMLADTTRPCRATTPFTEPKHHGHDGRSDSNRWQLPHGSGRRSG